MERLQGRDVERNEAVRDTIDMAREVKATAYTNRHYPDRTTYTFNPEKLESFVALVRADERESIKTICKEEQTEDAADLWNVCCTHIINKINEVNV
jgi:hypothetical protein